ncbi:MAG: translation initiation factor [Phycisphaerae bacterium]
MPGLFDGTPLERPVTCEVCECPLSACACPRNAHGSVLQPKDQQVRIGREKRRGKFVTVISGLDAAASDLPALLAKMRSLCAAGGTVADGKIEVQGDHRERAKALLTELGYPVKFSGG